MNSSQTVLLSTPTTLASHISLVPLIFSLFFLTIAHFLLFINYLQLKSQVESLAAKL